VRDWRYRLGEHRGTLLALVFFILMFIIYTSNHPVGFTPNVVQTAANKGVLLALVAMAQTFVVLTAGIDLSVGTVFVLTNCLASWIVVGSPAMTGLGIIGVLLTGLVCGAINGAIVIYGRLQPIVTTIATGAIYFGIALALRPVPGGDVNSDLADALTGRVFGIVPSSSSSGFRSGGRRSVARHTLSARRRSPPICRACRCARRSSSPMSCPA
jgi:ribose transport system permease protein